MSKRLVAGVLLLYRLGSWWSRSSPDVCLRTDLINVQKTDAFLTGFATLALVQFRNGDTLEPFHRIRPRGNTIEAVLRGDLEEQLARIRPQAIRFARAILTAHLHRLVRSDVAEVVIRFAPDAPGRGEPVWSLDPGTP
jgi:hypothetical protein